jgi:hypothetical protein
MSHFVRIGFYTPSRHVKLEFQILCLMVSVDSHVYKLILKLINKPLLTL